MTKAKNISANIVFMAVRTSEDVLKNHLERFKLHGEQRIKLPKLTTRRGIAKTSLQKQNTNYVYLLSSMWISKLFYITKIRVNHYHQNLSPPNSSNIYNVETESM